MLLLDILLLCLTLWKKIIGQIKIKIKNTYKKRIKEKEPKNRRIFDWISKIKKYCELRSLLYYVEVHLIQAPLEALLTVFLFYKFIIFLASTGGQKIPNYVPNHLIKMLIVLPAGICTLFLIFINTLFLFKVNSFIEKYILGLETPLRPIALYRMAEKHFRKVSWIIHVTGIICYYCVSVISVNNFGDYFDKYDITFPIKYRTILIIVGTFSGLIWNMRGFVGDRRIDWRKIFLKLKHIKLEEVHYKLTTYGNMRSLKFKYTALHIALNIKILLLISSLYILLSIFPSLDTNVVKFATSPTNVLSVEMDSQMDSQTDSFQGANLVAIVFDSMRVGTHGFFVVGFLIIFIFYTRTLFSLFYIDGNKIYSKFSDLIKHDKEEFLSTNIVLVNICSKKKDA